LRKIGERGHEAQKRPGVLGGPHVTHYRHLQRDEGRREQPSQGTVVCCESWLSRTGRGV
jgi:hypothetical protein